MQIQTRMGLSFDDVLLVPQLGVLRKRADANISTYLSPVVHLEVPIISAPMQAVTEKQMALAMRTAGGFGIIHRFMSIDEQVKEAKWFQHPTDYGVAIGVNEGYDRWAQLYHAGARIFCLDIAHAHNEIVGEFLSDAPSDIQQDIYMIVGNVATADGLHYLANLGVDAVKVGIGPGAACTTREVTGFGVPQLTAIMDCAAVRDEYWPNVHIMADGGIKNSGDIVKALAAGANSVMIGRLLAGADESPHPGLYWGMASKKVNAHHAPEGVEGSVPKTGPVKDTLKTLAWGIRSGVSYAGAHNLSELRENSEFMQVTSMSAIESGARL